MTYRCVDCVYSEIVDKKECTMKCIKKDINVFCMKNCCEELILTPQLFISHLIYASSKKQNNYIGWNESDKKAKQILKEHGFYGMQINE